MKFVNGDIKSCALCECVEVVITMNRREFVECNSVEDVARIMSLSEPVGSHGSEFLTAEVEFDLARPETEGVPEEEVPESEDQKTDPE